jgi:hypothetical protein
MVFNGPRHFLSWISGLLLALGGFIATTWAFGAVWFDGPFGPGNKLAAVLLAVVFAAVLLFVKPFQRKLGAFVVLFAGVFGWVVAPLSHQRSGMAARRCPAGVG